MIFATSNLLRVWVVESTRAKQRVPFQAHVTRSVFVRMDSVATSLAHKTISRLAVCFLGVAALAATLGSVTRVNGDQLYACELRFVGEESTQLGEGPTMQLCPLALSSPDPRANTTQVLKGDSTVRAFCERDDASRNYMVRIGGEPTLLTVALLQQPTRGLRFFPLELATQRPISEPNFVQFGSAVFVPVAIGSDLHDAQVHAEAIDGSVFPFFRNLHGDIQEPLIPAKNQVGLAPLVNEQCAGIGSADERNLGATGHRPDAHRGFRQLDGEHAGIVSDAAVLAKRASSFLIEFVGICHLGDEQASRLGREREAVPNLAIVEFVQWEAPEFFGLPREFGKPVASGVDGFQRDAQPNRLFGRWEQFDLDSQLHVATVVQSFDVSTEILRQYVRDQQTKPG